LKEKKKLTRWSFSWSGFISNIQREVVVGQWLQREGEISNSILEARKKKQSAYEENENLFTHLLPNLISQEACFFIVLSN